MMITAATTVESIRGKSKVGHESRVKAKLRISSHGKNSEGEMQGSKKPLE